MVLGALNELLRVPGVECEALQFPALHILKVALNNDFRERKD
jgi:hypothetical protein